MKGIQFNLSGRTAFFKKPDANIYYFTYNNIHKVALLGILGAITGLTGYNNQAEDDMYPQFYSELNKLKVSIVPRGDRGYFTKKMQTFNNSVGYASREDGGNLIVKEQWLENPEWDIYILDDGSIGTDIFEKLKHNLLNKQCVYVPYLGKNDHPSNIKNIRTIELNQCKNIEHIESLVALDKVKLGNFTYDDTELYFYKEMLPWGLDDTCNSYLFREMVFTNLYVEGVEDMNLFYTIDNKNLFFM